MPKLSGVKHARRLKSHAKPQRRKEGSTERISYPFARKHIKSDKGGTTRRVVRERRLPLAHVQADGPAVRPYLQTPKVLMRLKANGFQAFH